MCGWGSGIRLSLAAYANRLNITLLKAADFDVKLREYCCGLNVTIQAICKAAKDERDVRELLEAVWLEPAETERKLSETLRRNSEVFQFERMLQQKLLSKPLMH